MRARWKLWMLVLMFSSSVEAQSDTAVKSSWNRTYHHDIFPSTRVRAVNHLNPLLFKGEEVQQRELLQPVSKDRKKIGTSDKSLTGSAAAAVSSESVNISLRSMHMKAKSLKTLETQNSIVILSTDAASLSQVLRAVERRELRECDLVLVSDAGDSQQAVLRDLLPPEEVVHINTTEEVLKIVSESPMCRGYFSLLDNPEVLLTYTSNYHHSRSYHGRRRMRRNRRSAFNTGAGGTSCDNCSLALPLSMKVDQDLTLVSLVLYLLGLTTGRQFYLVYDDTIPGVADVVRAFQEVLLVDTVLLPYDPSILLLTEALTSNYHVQAMRNIFILCLATHVINLFEQVREKALESPTIRWFVIVDKDLTEDLPVVLREGTQVALVQRLTTQKAQLLSSRVNPDGQIGFHQVGSWTVSGAGRTTSHRVKEELVPDLQQLYSDLQGRQLVVATKDNSPFVKIKTLKNGTVLPISGIDLSVMNTLSEKLNFTYQLVLPPDGKWGGPKPDNTITGLVGQVARHEAQATLCELTITDIRETVVDFTMPYYLESMTLVSPAPKEKNRSFAVLSPFTVEVWLCICLVTMLVGPLLYLVTRLLVLYLGEEDSPHLSLQNLSFNMYRNLMVQGNLIASHRWSLRSIFFCWYLFSFYIYAMYSGTLTAALAITAFEKPINSLYELAQARREGYTIGTLRDTNYETTFKRAKSGIYQEVWQLFDHKDRDRSFLPSQDSGFDMVEKDKYVFIIAQLNSRLKATQRGREKFYIARETFLPQGYGIACSSGSPFKDIFDRILMRVTEVGLVNKWINVEVNKVSKYASQSSDPGPKAISLQHLQAAFFIMVLGFAISASVLVMEITASIWRRKTKRVCIEEAVVQVEDHPSQSSHTAEGLWWIEQRPFSQIQ